MPTQEMTGGDTIQGQPPKTPPFITDCFSLRAGIEAIKIPIKGLMKHQIFTGQPVGSPMDFGEMKANIMLAYRHLEDARMRLGKAVQAYDGGKSCYPR